MINNPSKYQIAIRKAFNLTNKDISISAVAGSGKTTVLLDLLSYIPKGSSSIFLAFNNSIVNELKERNSRDDVKIMTIHSCGWRSILCQRGGKIKMNPNKGIEKAEKVVKKIQASDKKKRYYLYAIPKMLDLMRCNLCNNNYDEISELAINYDIDLNKQEISYVQRAYEYMMSDNKQFDFMDMIYEPVINKQIFVKKYDYVFCDESQDMSLCQIAFIKLCLSKTGRLITVGDKRQSIYGFCGADAESYEKLCNVRGKSIQMPLSVSYRCAKNIIREAQKIVPYIQYSSLSDDGIVNDNGSLMDIQDGDWILCRNLKPLIQTYIWLTKNKVKCKVRGRDIGGGIINLIHKIGSSTISGLLYGLDAEYEHLCNKLTERGVYNPATNSKTELLQQRIEVIQYLCQEVDDVNKLVRLIENIFTDDTNGILLSTIHKAKGLEHDKIFLICPELIPSRYAVLDWQLEQENNLMYVAITRAKKELVYVHSNVFVVNLDSDFCFK